MKSIFRWFLKMMGSALTISVAIVMIPYLSRLAASLLPDESGAAIRTSAVLSSKLENSARLETLHVEDTGVLDYSVSAALLGPVGSISFSYTYEASFGIELSEVEMQISGNVLTFILPPVILLQDALTPVEVDRNDYLIPGFSDSDYEKLKEEERIACREKYLSGEYEQQLWEATTEAFAKTISSWLQEVHPGLTFNYVQAENP